MIDFFTKTLSGTTYIIVLIVCIILILALIGVMSEVNYIKTIDNPSKKDGKKEEEKPSNGTPVQTQVNTNSIPSAPPQMNTANVQTTGTNVYTNPVPPVFTQTNVPIPPIPMQQSPNQPIVPSINQEHMN